MTKTDREKGLDFARAISALGIVVFHFYCHSSSNRKLFYTFANGGWGSLLNCAFFALSGLVIHMKYGSQDRFVLKRFYYKRWKATIPAYLAVFFYAFSMNVFSAGRLFYLDIPKSRILLTLIGMDGYSAWIIPTYFITGEWFLGGILIAYAVYPILRKLMNKSMPVTFGAMVLLCVIALQWDWLGLPQLVNPMVCLLSFSGGMVMASCLQLVKDYRTGIAAAIILAVLLIVPLTVSEVLSSILAGWSILIVLYHLGERLCKNELADRVIQFVSRLSYPIFLIHHRIIYQVLEGFDTTSTVKSLGVLGMILAVTLVFAKVLDVVMKSFLNCAAFRKLEQSILKLY